MSKFIYRNRAKISTEQSTPGTIILTKKNWLGRQLAKLTGKEEYSEVNIAVFKAPIFNFTSKEMIAYFPKKEYNAKEVKTLMDVYNNMINTEVTNYNPTDVLTLVNIIRPNTIEKPESGWSQLDNSKYYTKKVLEFNEL